jgi:hypothetical protein
MRYILNDPSRTEEIHALMRCGTNECESAGYCPLCDSTSSGTPPAPDCPNQPAARKKSSRRVSRKQ